MHVRIVQIDKLAKGIKHLTLAPVNDYCLAPFVAGSHIRLGVPQLAGTKRAPFSLTGWNARRYQIVVHNNNGSGPVARWLHDEARPGELVDVSEPRCGLRLHPRAMHHCLVAGGSGITAFFSHLDSLRRHGRGYELHYAFKDRSDGIWCDDLRAAHGARFRQYVSAEGEHLDLSCLLSAQPLGTHVYVCGPARFIQSAIDAARRVGFPIRAIHWDAFGWRPSMSAPGERARQASGARGESQFARPKAKDNYACRVPAA